MKQVTMHEAKTHLSRLVDLALAGEDVVISRRDKPLVRLIAIREKRKRRRVGGLPGLIRAMGDDFNTPLDDWTDSMIPNSEKRSQRPPGTRRRPIR